MPPDPLTRFDNFIVGEIFSNLPLHDLTRSLYNVSRGWRRAVVSTGALKRVFLNETSLSMHERRRLKAQGNAASEPLGGGVDWRELALAHLRQEQAWVTGKPRVHWLRQVFNPDNIVFHPRINDEGDYYLARLPWLTPEGFAQPHVTLIPINLPTMTPSDSITETRSVNGVRTEYCVIGRMVVYTPRPCKGWAQIWVTEQAWNDDFGARERSFIEDGVSADQQHEDTVFDGLKCLATFPVRADMPRYYVHITTSADLQHFDVYVVSDMKDRSQVYRLATTRSVKPEGLIHDIEHLPSDDPLEVITMDDYYVFRRYHYSLEVHSRRTGDHVTTLTTVALAGTLDKPMSPPAFTYQVSLADLVVRNTNIGFRVFKANPGNTTRECNIHDVDVEGFTKDGPRYQTVAADMAARERRLGNFGFDDFQMDDNDLLLFRSSGAFYVIQDFHQVLRDAEDLEYDDRLDHIAKHTVLIDTTFGGSDLLSETYRMTLHGRRVVMATYDCILLFDLGRIPKATSDSPHTLTCRAITGPVRELGAFDIGQERYLIDRTGIYEAVNLCSLHEDEYKQGMSADASMVPWEDEWMTRAEGYEPCCIRVFRFE